jgi:hypothetical protein
MRCGACGLALIAAMLLMLVGGVAAAQDKPAEKPASKPAEKAADKPADNLMGGLGLQGTKVSRIDK